jgi:hypothetical protein
MRTGAQRPEHADTLMLTLKIAANPAVRYCPFPRTARSVERSLLLVQMDYLRVSGVEIHAITEGITDDDRTAGSAIAMTLQKFGFRVTHRDRPDVGNPTFHIYLIVGRKPTECPLP